MNWLAHVFLSEQNIDFQLGNFLADPMKGKSWDQASEDILRGINTHILIDKYTDSHQVVSLSKSRLREKGLLKPVIIDLVYDYFLSKHWETFCKFSKTDFLATFNKQALDRVPNLPEPAQSHVKNLVLSDRLNRYNSLQQLKGAFERIDTRLSPKLLAKESTLSYFETVCALETELESDFLEFFPDLSSHVKISLNRDKLNHWV